MRNDPFETLDDPPRARPIEELAPERGAVAGAAIDADQVRSVLLMNGEFPIGFRRPRPNAWWRFWQWLFLGFVWQKIR
jgi:hypothetical protein